MAITPDGMTERPRPRLESSLVKAVARAHRWQRILESGECGNITELARPIPELAPVTRAF